MSIEEVAQQIECAEWEARQQVRPAPPTYQPNDPKYGPEECAECDEPMLEQWRAAGHIQCTACRELDEQRRKRRFGLGIGY
jgi:hypothetical protein